MNQVAIKTENPLIKLNEQLEVRTQQFSAALPAHIPVERFKRVLLTAIQNNSALARADRQTLFNAAMKAAQDGLLCDGREAAMVIYRTKVQDKGQDVWIEAVQYIPMIAGLRKKVRNSGEIATWDAQVVYEKDEFEYELGDAPFIKHKPFMGGDGGKIIAAYSVAVLKTGEKSREVMTISQIEKVRSISKSKDKGPWVDHYSEMCRKTVARRHSKVLPMSTDLDDLIRRDDDLYDIAGHSDASTKPTAARPTMSDFVDMPANAPLTEYPKAKAKPVAEVADKQTGEVTTVEEEEAYSAADAWNDGNQAAADGKTLADLPKHIKALKMDEAWTEGFKSYEPEVA